MRAFKRKFIHVIFKSGRLENMYVIQKEYISGNVLKKRIATSNVKNGEEDVLLEKCK
jgi:hypothetical protein